MQSSTHQSRWLLNAPLDVLLTCGGFPALLWLATFGFDSNAMTICAAVTVVATHALSEMHTLATVERAARHPSGARNGAFVLLAAVVSVLLVMSGLFIDGWVTLLAQIYFVWASFHFASQCYGVVSIYCRKQQLELPHVVRKRLKMAMALAALISVVRQFLLADRAFKNSFTGLLVPMFGGCDTFSDFDFDLVVQKLVFSGLGMILAVAILAWLWAACTTVSAIKANVPKFPFPAALVLTGASAFLLVGCSSAGALAIYLPSLYHALQYLAVNYVESKQVALTSKRDAAQFLFLLWCGSVFVYAAIPAYVQHCGIAGSRAFAAVFFGFNIFHYLLDSVLWRSPRLFVLGCASVKHTGYLGPQRRLRDVV